MVKCSAAPAQIASHPIPRQSSNCTDKNMREPHFDFIRDKDTRETNDLLFEAVQKER